MLDNIKICKECNRVHEYYLPQYIEQEDGTWLCIDCYQKKNAPPCSSCGRTINDRTYELDGNLLCKTCYESKFAEILERMMLTTTNNFDGYKVVKYLGIESVEIVIGTGWFSEFTGEVSDFFGVRSSSFEKKLQKAKTIATLLLKEKAYKKGANAIIGVDLDYTEFSGNRVGIILNGTLVIIRKINLQ